MDDIAHILWSVVIFYHYNWWVAALFGILPDLLVFAPFYVLRLKEGRLRRIRDAQPKSDVHFYPRWVLPWYGVTHSLVFVLATISAATALFGYHLTYWAMLIHVLVDIPSHSREPFGTKLFWPFSKWRWNGGTWATRDFMLANYTCIALAYAIRLWGL